MNPFYTTIGVLATTTITCISYAQTFQAVTQFGGTEDVYAPSFFVGENNQKFLAGGFRGTMDCDPAAGFVPLSAMEDRRNSFYLELNQNNELIANSQFALGGIQSGNNGSKIVAGINNEIYLVGTYEDSIVDPSGVTISAPSFGQRDIFVAKFNAARQLIWLKDFGSEGQDSFRDVVFNRAMNEIVLLGQEAFYSSINLDPNDPTAVVVNPSTFSHCFISRLNAETGAYLGSNAMYTNDDNSSIRPSKIGVDEQGSIYISGEFQGSFLIGSTTYVNNSEPNSGPDAFLLRWNDELTGTPYWMRIIGQESSEETTSMSISETGSIYLTGWFGEPFEYEGILLNNEEEIIGQGCNRNIFAAKFSRDGSLNWIQSFGGIKEEQVYAAAVSGNRFIVAGVYNGYGVFGDDTLHLPAGSASPTHVFILSMDTMGIASPPVQYGSSYNWYDYVYDLQIHENKLFISGYIEHETDFDPNPNNDTHTLPAGAGRTGYLLELSLNGGSASLTPVVKDLVAVYPNPASELIQLDSKGQQLIATSLYDLAGEHIPLAPNEQQIIDISQLAPGMYFLKVTTSIGSQTVTITKL